MSLLHNKPVAVRSSHFVTAWRKFAPEVELAGFSVAQFAAEAADVEAVRQEISAARTLIAGLIQTRDMKELALNDHLVNIASSVRGNPNLGEDCSFYRALGFVPKSEQRRGRPRKTKQGL